MRLRIRQAPGLWRQPAQREHQDESQLRERLIELLHVSPALVLGEGASLPPAIATEFPTPAGRIDLVAVDPLGGLTLCECKLARNPAIRRQLIGQLLEYAGALQGMQARRFRETFDRRATTALNAALQSWEDEIELSENDLMEALEASLDTGRFRLLVVVDELGENLKETLLYLNDQVSSAVLALELAYARDDGMEFLLPTLHGQEAAERKAPSQGGSQTVLDADTVVVPAKFAYADYEALSAYICQPDRSFREEVEFMAFYREKAIQPLVPRIIRRHSRVPFTPEAAERRASSASGDDQIVGPVIKQALKAEWSTRNPPGSDHMIFILTGPGDKNTLRLPQPVAHEGRGAWTQGQRYTRSDAMQQARTTDELQAAGG